MFKTLQLALEVENRAPHCPTETLLLWSTFSNFSQTVYLCSETPEKSGERGVLAEGGKVDAGKGEGKAEDEAEVKAGVVAEARTTTTLATREAEMVVLIPEVVEDGDTGAVGGEAAEVGPAEDGVRRTGEEEAVVKAGVVAEAMGTTTTAMAAEVVEGGGVGAVGGEVDPVEDGVRRMAVGGGPR